MQLCQSRGTIVPLSYMYVFRSAGQPAPLSILVLGASVGCAIKSSSLNEKGTFSFGQPLDFLFHLRAMG